MERLVCQETGDTLNQWPCVACQRNANPRGMRWRRSCELDSKVVETSQGGSVEDLSRRQHWGGGWAGGRGKRNNPWVDGGELEQLEGKANFITLNVK